MIINEPADSEQGAEHFEQQLRQFRPIAPPALKMPARRRRSLAFAALAATLAIIVLICARQPSPRISITSRKVNSRTTVNTPHLTATQLRDAWLASDEDFNRLLDDASATILPHGQQGTVLYELGKE